MLQVGLFQVPEEPGNSSLVQVRLAEQSVGTSVLWAALGHPRSL